MKCKEFQNQIEGYLCGTLRAPQRGAAHAHAVSCPECGGLARALREPPGVDDELTGAILAQTTGTACGRADEWTVRGADTPETADLLERHRAHCPACRRIQNVVAQLDATLPELAEVTPPASFLAEVLERTTRRVPRWAWVQQRVATVWTDLSRRPNFSMELAYAVTVVLVMLTATPGSPLQPVAQASLRWLQSDAKAGALPLEFAEAGSSQVTGLVAGVKGDLSERGSQIATVWERVTVHGIQLGDALRDGDRARVEIVIDDLGCDAKLLWQGVCKHLPEGEPRCGDD